MARNHVQFAIYNGCNSPATVDSKAKVLGLPKEKHFDLLANWRDRTLLRNDVSCHIANLTNTMGWNPTGKFVEVALNGKHIGNYYHCEHIKVSENRVNITEIDKKHHFGRCTYRWIHHGA